MNLTRANVSIRRRSPGRYGVYAVLHVGDGTDGLAGVVLLAGLDGHRAHVGDVARDRDTRQWSATTAAGHVVGTGMRTQDDAVDALLEYRAAHATAPT